MTDTLTAPTVLRAETNDAGQPTRMWLATELETPDENGSREVSGTFTLYDVEVDRRNWLLGTTKFKIAAGAMTMNDDARAFYGHDWQVGGTPIGRVTNSEFPETPTGTITISKTAKGDEIYTLCLDGTLTQFSVGFDVLEYAVENADTDQACLVILSAAIFECSIVWNPQFVGATVDNVLSATTKGISNMTDTLNPADPAPVALSKEDGDELRSSIDQLAAKVALLGNAVTVPDNPAELFSSYGEFVQAMCSADHDKHGDAEKLAVALADGDYEGGVVGDTTYTKTWVGDITRFIEKARKTWNLFETAPLPAQGMQLEYGQVTEDTLDVAKQIAEGNKLVMGKIKVGTKHADVFTFGGASEMSFQQVQRSSVGVVDFTFKSLARAYGKTTEAFMKTTLDGLTGTETLGSIAALDDTDAWTAFLIDVGLYYDDLGLEPEYLRVSKDVLTTLATLRQGVDGPHVLTRENGSVNLLNAEGNVSGVKLVLRDGAGKLEFGNSFALKTYESPGAPARLGPEQSILHLTQAVGVYGFDAIAVQEPKAIVRAGA